MVLQAGETCPNFEFSTKEGRSMSFLDVKGRKIVFFFPKAFTKGCTAEACSLQDTYADLKERNVEVFGISTDNEETMKKFAETYKLEYTLVPDPDGKISKQFGVFKNYVITKLSDRVTFIINEEGKVEEVIYNGIRGGGSKYGLNKHGIELLELVSADSK